MGEVSSYYAARSRELANRRMAERRNRDSRSFISECRERRSSTRRACDRSSEADNAAVSLWIQRFTDARTRLQS